MVTPTEVYAEAIDAMNRGQWRRSQALAEGLLRIAPQAVDVHYIAGVSALQLHALPRALEHLRRATELEPDRGEYLSQYARALAMAGDLPNAASVADKAMTLETPQDAVSSDTLGIVFSRAGLHERATEAFSRAVEAAPDHAGYHFNLATSLMFYGNVDSAEAEFERCIAIDHRYWRAYLAVSHLRRQTTADNHLPQLRGLLSEFGNSAEARMHLNLALAKELEDMGDVDGAFAHCVSGKSAYRVQLSVSDQLRHFDRLIHAFDKADGSSDGLANREAIFIVGMPRSGTTIVDRILSSHSEVHSAGELHAMGLTIRKISGLPSRNLIETAANLGANFHDWHRVGTRYINCTRSCTGHTPRFTDKFPLNFLFVGHIAKALPQAKIICLRRHPMDTCLSNFRQLFTTDSSDYNYSFDLLDTGRYFICFDRLMRHWQSIMPGRIIEVSYEALVSDPAANTRMLLQACDLPWEDACLNFERAAGPAATASAIQVRSPMNQDSMYRWKKYEKHLVELRELLTKEGIRVD